MIQDFPNILEHNFKTEQNMELDMFQKENIYITNQKWQHVWYCQRLKWNSTTLSSPESEWLSLWNQGNVCRVPVSIP